LNSLLEKSPNLCNAFQDGKVRKHRRSRCGVGCIDHDAAALGKSGKLTAEHTAGGHRRYDLAKLRPERFRAETDAARRTIAYARVSRHDPRDDLERQKRVLELYCARQGWPFEVIADLGSGMNDHKKGLKK
jgi:predicted site-specific integrase-resolvase